MKAAKVPPLADRQRPGLSETLTGPRAPNACQSCGSGHRLTRFLEHDAWDRVPTPPVCVVLCAGCVELLIEDHPRLYRALDGGEPFPGCMGVCLDCPNRQGVTCVSPAAQVNGGPGLTYTWDKPPIYAHLSRSPRALSGFMTIYSGPVRSCTGKP